MDSNSLAKAALANVKFSPYWLDAGGKPSDLPSLSEHLESNLLIVGAGFTGLWAAIQAKEEQPNREIIVIEANTVAIGASGRPAAILSTSVMQ